MTVAGIWFDYPLLLILAAALPLLAIWMLQRAYRRRRARLERLGELPVVLRLVPPAALVPPRWRSARLAGAAALVGIAVAGPRWGEERNVIRSSGIDMVLALDASLSMMAPDERPTRLDRMKQEVRRLRSRSPGDRIGLIAFAGRSYILTPLTVDQGALDLYLDNLDPSVVGQAGSSLARAIRQATDLLMLSKSSADKAIVVMSDGEAFEPPEDVTTEAKRAADAGISIVTVGFGTTQGSTIPIDGTSGQKELKRDEQGQVVVSRYTPTLLKAAADAAGGTFIPAEATDKADRVKQSLASLRRQARTTVGGEAKTPRYQWFLLPAVLLLLLDSFVSERRGRRRRHAAAAEPASVAAVLLLALFLGGCARQSAVENASAAFNARQYARSAELYRAAIDAGDKRATTIYNFGTSLLAADSLERAAEVLERAAEAQDAELRYRALFNLGLAHLRRGLAAPQGEGTESLDAALAAYKKVLLMRWQDVDAKWNYELALRKKQSGGGGGGGGSSDQSNAQNQQNQSEQPQPSGGLGQRQADQLLGSAAREEREVQSKKQKQNRIEPPPGGKDW